MELDYFFPLEACISLVTLNDIEYLVVLNTAVTSIN